MDYRISYRKKVNGIRKRLQLSEQFIPLAVVLIGYPGEETEAKDKWDPKKNRYSENDCT